MRQYMALGVLALTVFTACSESDETTETGETVAYRQEMRDFVMTLASYAKNLDLDFLIVPQNGQELITDTGEGDGVLQTAYVSALDGTGRESMFYGYYQDDELTPEEDKEHLLDLCTLCEANQVEVLSTDYCFTQPKMDDSYTLNAQFGFSSFAASERELNVIPAYPAPIWQENSQNVENLADVQNFLYLINGGNFADKGAFIAAVTATNYDALIMDLFHDDVSFTAQEVTQLKSKANGGQRLLLCYMSIGEAEDYRYYWQNGWSVGDPVWLEAENPDWAGNFKVRYWNEDWQALIYGSEESYLGRVLAAGFDGVYLDIVDGFEFFEER